MSLQVTICWRQYTAHEQALLQMPYQGRRESRDNQPSITYPTNLTAMHIRNEARTYPQAHR